VPLTYRDGPRTALVHVASWLGTCQGAGFLATVQRAATQSQPRAPPGAAPTATAPPSTANAEPLTHRAINTAQLHSHPGPPIALSRSTRRRPDGATYTSYIVTPKGRQTDKDGHESPFRLWRIAPNCRADGHETDKDGQRRTFGTPISSPVHPAGIIEECSGPPCGPFAFVANV
jgi:hypothetical protein